MNKYKKINGKYWSKFLQYASVGYATVKNIPLDVIARLDEKQLYKIILEDIKDSISNDNKRGGSDG